MKQQTKKEIGNRFNQLRQEMDLTQVQIANKIDFSRSNLSKIESGVIFPNSSLLIKLAEHYNISANWLLTGKGEMFAGLPPKSSLKDLYPKLPSPELWEQLMESISENPDQALLRIHELKKQEHIDCKTFLELGYKTLRTKEEMIKIYESKYGEYKDKTGNYK